MHRAGPGAADPGAAIERDRHMTVTIYHNQACGTSRNTLALIRNSGIEPTVIEYLKTSSSQAELLDLVRRMGVPLQSILRRKDTPFDELRLEDADEAALL